MNRFNISPAIDRRGRPFLNRTVEGFYHANYNSGGNWNVPGTIENMIWTLKNDVSPFPLRLRQAKEQLGKILRHNLPEIMSISGITDPIVCVVPRAKMESYYRADQLYFREVVSNVVSGLTGFVNGARYITRTINTKTTHLARNGEGGDGELPYPGITRETCIFSDEIVGKNIILIDDLYTKSVNIDEDAIQALFDKGAKSVIFYSIGKTVSRLIL